VIYWLFYYSLLALVLFMASVTVFIALSHALSFTWALLQ